MRMIRMTCKIHANKTKNKRHSVSMIIMILMMLAKRCQLTRPSILAQFGSWGLCLRTRQSHKQMLKCSRSILIQHIMMMIVIMIQNERLHSTQQFGTKRREGGAGHSQKSSQAKRQFFKTFFWILILGHHQPLGTVITFLVVYQNHSSCNVAEAAMCCFERWCKGTWNLLTS